jgi:DNA-binding NarL/FixJ family response regulator
MRAGYGSHKRCILIADADSLLGVAIIPFLLDEANVYMGEAISGEGVNLLETVNNLRPDIVILDEGYFLRLSLNILVRLLGHHPQVLVIVVNGIDDRVQIYYKNQVRVTRLAKLMRLLRGSKTWLAKGVTTLAHNSS